MSSIDEKALKLFREISCGLVEAKQVVTHYDGDMDKAKAWLLKNSRTLHIKACPASSFTAPIESCNCSRRK